MYRITADLHTHTLVSNHAFNTITEMARAAKEMGYCALAVTDHGPAMPDSPHIWYFYNVRRLPDVLEGIPVLKGAEANVMDVNGTLDLPAEVLNGLDWVIASIHTDCLPGTLTVEQATDLWLKVAENPAVDMIGHSEQARHVYDYERVAKVFAEHHKVVELNGNSWAVRPEGAGNMKALALACKKGRLPGGAEFRRPLHLSDAGGGRTSGPAAGGNRLSRRAGGQLVAPAAFGGTETAQ